MTGKTHHEMLAKYAEAIVKVGLNIRTGQRLIITAAGTRGVPHQFAPLVREIAASRVKPRADALRGFSPEGQQVFLREVGAGRAGQPSDACGRVLRETTAWIDWARVCLSAIGTTSNPSARACPAYSSSRLPTRTLAPESRRFKAAVRPRCP